jgi:DNA polymerase-3 subunit chi
MTRIDFYSNADPRLQAVCLLVGKAFSRRMKVLIFAPEVESAQSMDRLLWTFRATSFIPHCFGHDKLAGSTPIVISRDGAQPGHDEVMVNLSPDCPPTFSRFRRLIEVVGKEPEERGFARERWRFYKERGYEVNHIDLAQPAS